MKKVILYTLLIVAFPFFAAYSSDGEQLFKQHCAVCHWVNKGRLVGPDLANVHKRRTEEWILKFVKSSQTFINSGDPDAIAIFEEYNKTIMPDALISEDEIKAVIGYIASISIEEEVEADDETVEVPSTPEATLLGNHENGGQLFAGISKFQNGGPTCNSCHHVYNDAVITGGAFAKDLTEAHSRLTGAGVRAMVSNPAFPAMKKAYQDHPLTEQEVADIAAFLQHADEERLYQSQGDYRQVLPTVGIPGAIILLLIFFLVGLRRKSRTVNHKIYDRQIKSSS